MLAADFPQRNAFLGKPETMTDEQCYSLPIHRYSGQDGTPAIISRWRFNKEEMDEMIRTGDVWVNTLGATLAPFSLHGENPFMGLNYCRYDPVLGKTIEDTVAGALRTADKQGMAAEFFFNGVIIRVYPGGKVPPEVYVELYKAKSVCNSLQDIISQANAEPIPEG